MELEEELKVVGNSLKSLEVSEEKVSLLYSFSLHADKFRRANLFERINLGQPKSRGIQAPTQNLDGETKGG